MSDRPSIHVLLAQAEVIHAVQREDKMLLWHDSRRIVGTLRHGTWTAEGQLSSSDPRDACVRITTSTGLEMWLPFATLVDALLDNNLHLPAWRRGRKEAAR